MPDAELRHAMPNCSASGSLALEKENALLRQKIDLLVRQLFGAKSEQLDPAQLLLLLQGMDDAGKSPGARGRGGPTALDGPIASA